MGIFACDKCGCIENTASSRYWLRDLDKETKQFIGPALCSLCDPKIGKWHNIFERKNAAGLFLASDGFLYSKAEVEGEFLRWRIENQGLKIIKVIGEDSPDYDIDY